MDYSFKEIELLQSSILAYKEMEIDIGINALNTLISAQEVQLQKLNDEFKEYIDNDER